MLLIDLTITTPCTKDANLAEMHEVRRERVRMASGGHEYRPVMGGVYAAGVVVGWPEIKAPIDLLPGDEVHVTGEEYLVWDVSRAGVVAWTNKRAHSEDAAKTTARMKKLGLS